MTALIIGISVLLAAPIFLSGLYWCKIDKARERELEAREIIRKLKGLPDPSFGDYPGPN